MAGNLVKSVTLQITGEIRDAAAKVGLIRKDVQDLADKSPVELKAELTGSEEVKARLKEIEANAERLKREFPEFAAKIEIGAASAKLAILRAEIRHTADTAAEAGRGGFGGLGRAFAGVASGALSAVAPLASSVTLLGALAVVAAGAVIALGPLVAALLPITAGFTIFAAIGVSSIGKVIKARTALEKAEQQYDAATTKAQRAAALKAEAAATAGLTGAQKGLLGPMDQIAKQFGSLSRAAQPFVIRAFSQALRIIKDLMPALTPLVKAAGKALDALLKNMGDWLESPAGKKFLHWLETAGPKDIANFGKFLWTFARDAGGALKWLADAGNDLDNRLRERWRDIKVVSQDLRNWIWRDFVQKISSFFTNTIPNAADILRDDLHLAFDRIAIFALNLVLDITTTFGHLPGRMGQPFRDASAAIRTELGHMKDDVAATAARINAEWDTLHGKKVALTFSLDLPPGVTYPSRHIKHGARGIRGAAAGTWLVGEEGPELAWLPQGTHVLPAGPTSRIMGGLAGGTTGPRFGWELPATGGLGAAFQAAINALTREIRNLIGVLKVHVPGGGGGMGGSGVQRWAPLVSRVLGMLSQPGADIGVALRQMQTESGGNPLAVNKTDSNWLAGHPSVGLMQVIAGTFGAYAGPFRNTGPFEYGVSVDPLANIFAGLNYAVHRYGPAWPRVLGQGHGYDSGTQYLPVGASIAVNTTGRPERVGGEDLAPLLRQVIVELRKLPGVQAAQLGRVLSGRPAAPRPSVFASR